MKEIRDIIAAYDQALLSGKQTALATVVQVEGSSYRREGARMLVTEDGQLTGAISGGCLEGDALRKARLVMAQGKAMLVTYDTREEDDAKLGLGLGCNGVIRILIEPIDSQSINHPLVFLKAAAEQRLPSVLTTIFSLDKRATQPGTCLWLKEGGLLENRKGTGSFPNLAADAFSTLQTDASAMHAYGDYCAFFSLIQPARSLLIFGAGNDAVPLTEIAHTLGWEATVIDGRPNYATAVRFPRAQRVLVAKPEIALSQLSIDAQTAVVLMTHNYRYDLAMLRQLLLLPCLPYIGLLGPKQKLERMLEELTETGLTYSSTQLQRLHGPTGLDIGAATPEEIALSIAAEVQAVFTRKSGEALRDRLQPIHV